MEQNKEIYYKLSDNADLKDLYLQSMTAVTEYILTELGDVDKAEIPSIQYTIEPVLMTQEEFENLPEYEF